MSKSGLLARQKAERELWTIKVIAYTEQQTLDAVCLALAEGFGFGEERLKRFHQRQVHGNPGTGKGRHQRQRIFHSQARGRT